MRREVVDLVGIHVVEQRDERKLVEQVAFPDLDAVPQMRDALERLGRGATHHADDVVSLLQEELGQIRPVLAGDAGNEGSALTDVSHSSILADNDASPTNL